VRERSLTSAEVWRAHPAAIGELLLTRTRASRWQAAAGLAIALVVAITFLPGPAATGAISLLSQGAPATASSSEGSLSAAAAVDGNTGTRWSSTHADGQWIRVDLGVRSSIDRVELNWEAAYASAFDLQVSADGQRWVTVRKVTNGAGGRQTVQLSAVGRYVRLLAVRRATSWGVSLWEFQVYGERGTNSIPSGAVRVAEFLAECPFTHRLPDDPIVAPGLPGGSHMHSFFGNVSTNANSNLATLQAARTSCLPATDPSSYWVPTLYANDQPVEPTGTTFYYLGEAVRPEVTAIIQPFPLGLRIVAGNARATSTSDNTIARWSCLHAGHVPPSSDFVNCPSGTMLESYLDFPQCWNGTDLDSADHKSHMSYPVNGDCPATHPVPVPKLRQVLRYPVSGDPARFRLASGRGYTMHGDFFNVWPEAELERRVRDCINPVVKCGFNGTP
jgi:uncharacterized protein DUF1996/F5/8 type C domain-containing protein